MILGGERRVVELLENESRKQLTKPLLEGRSESHGVERRSFVHFFFRPYLLGRDLFTIEKFGLVQYVSHSLLHYMVLVRLLLHNNFFFPFAPDDSEDIMCISGIYFRNFRVLW